MARPLNEGHIHKYKKVDLSRKRGEEYLVYKCVKPGCTHYVRMELAEGKICECHRCGDMMVINKLVLTGSANGPMTKPHCINCVKRKDKTSKEDVDAIASFIAGNKA